MLFKSQTKQRSYIYSLTDASGRSRPEIIFLVLLAAAIALVFVGYPRQKEESSVQSEQVRGLILPARGAWNSVHGQQNSVECENLKSEEVSFEISVFSADGAPLGNAQVISIAANGAASVPLNDIGAAYGFGTYLIKTPDSSAKTAALSCRTMIYNMPASPSMPQLAYAFSIPVQDPLSGESAGIYNSINPEGTERPVHNWLSIYNQGSASFSATVRRYSDTGSEEPDIRLQALRPGERRDIALGHEDGQNAGIYRIVPDDLTQPYGAFLSRFGTRTDTDTNFALALAAKPGDADTGPVPASTMGPARNWAEIANVSPETAQVSIELYSRDGELLLREEREIAAAAQYHILLDTALGTSSVGFLRVRSVGSGSTKLIVNSISYGFNPDHPRMVNWALTSQAKGNGLNQLLAKGDRLVFPINTSRNAANWLKLINGDPDIFPALHARLAIYDSAGERISVSSPELSFNTMLDFPIHEQVGPDFTGKAVVEFTEAWPHVNAEVVRVLAEGKQMYAVPPMRISPLSAAQSDQRGGSLIFCGHLTGTLKERCCIEANLPELISCWRNALAAPCPWWDVINFPNTDILDLGSIETAINRQFTQCHQMCGWNMPQHTCWPNCEACMQRFLACYQTFLKNYRLCLIQPSTTTTSSTSTSTRSTTVSTSTRSTTTSSSTSVSTSVSTSTRPTTTSTSSRTTSISTTTTTSTSTSTSTSTTSIPPPVCEVTVLKHPANKKVRHKDAASFGVQYTIGAECPDIKIKWQRKRNGATAYSSVTKWTFVDAQPGTKWTRIEFPADYNKDQLSKYRVKFYYVDQTHGTAPLATSKSAELTVLPRCKATIEKNPLSKTVNSGDEASFGVYYTLDSKCSGAKLQWERQVSGGQFTPVPEWQSENLQPGTRWGRISFTAEQGDNRSKYRAKFFLQVNPPATEPFATSTAASLSVK